MLTVAIASELSPPPLSVARMAEQSEARRKETMHSGQPKQQHQAREARKGRDGHMHLPKDLTAATPNAGTRQGQVKM